MTVLGRLLESRGLVAFLGRARAWMWRARGAKLAASCTVGSLVEINKPWRLSAGARTDFERLSFIKVVKEEASLSFGESCFIGYGTEINVALSVNIGSRVLIAPHCFITDHNHNFDLGKPIACQGCTSAAVVIGDDVWLGAGVIVLPGVTIHPGAVVGAGAVVSTDVPAASIVAGVPARLIRTRS